MSIQNKGNEQKDNENYSKNFARIPNMLFASFKHLSKEEKFLYCTLKSVYWDARPRYVSLRELSELTGYSRSALGAMLPRLDTCGLVHAEIRKEKDKHGNEVGNAKYNITILDIWELNKEYYSCPPERQDSLDPSLILVHENVQACPRNKPSLSTKAAKPVHENVQVRAQAERAKKEKERIKTSLKEEEESASLSSPALSIWNLWCEAQGYIVKRDWTKIEKERCITLATMCKEASIDLTPKLMNEVREWAQAKQSFLRNDWALKNLINALPDYFKYASSVTQQLTMPELPALTAEEAAQEVLWSKTPGKIGSDIASFWRILEWMPKSEACKHYYSEDSAFSTEEIEQYEQLAGQQEGKRLRLV